MVCYTYIVELQRELRVGVDHWATETYVRRRGYVCAGDLFICHWARER